MLKNWLNTKVATVRKEEGRPLRFIAFFVFKLPSLTELLLWFGHEKNHSRGG